MTVANLRKVYRRSGREIVAVDDVSFQVRAGEVVGLLGPNGAGKTTTIKCILGLLVPTSGSVRICGFDPRRQARQALRRVGAVLEGTRNLHWRIRRWQLTSLTACAGVWGRSGGNSLG